jgi:pimeloyl-ACP methyl ester carboxylesterase
MQTQSATVDGITMRWLEAGEGTPVVLVHGIPTSPQLWRHVIPHREGRALAWEMVGFGGSIPEGRGRDIGLDRQADHLLAFLDHLGIDRAVLAGHDLGGGVVQIAAVRAAERCAGLFLTNAVAYDSWPIPSVKAMRALSAAVERTPDAAFRGVLASLLWRGHDDRGRAREALDVHWQPYARHGAAAAMIHQVRALDVMDTLAIQDELPRLDVPARIVWGAADQFQKVAYGERLARALRAPLHRIEGGRHFTPEDHPDVVATHLNDLVREVGAGS